MVLMVNRILFPHTDNRNHQKAKEWTKPKRPTKSPDSFDKELANAPARRQTVKL